MAQKTKFSVYSTSTKYKGFITKLDNQHLPCLQVQCHFKCNLVIFSIQIYAFLLKDILLIIEPDNELFCLTPEKCACVDQITFREAKR